MDVIYVGLIAALFALIVALMKGCARLARANSPISAGTAAKSPAGV